MLVQGEDPTAGIRPIPKNSGLFKQHRAPGARRNKHQLQDVMVSLAHYSNQKIDIITAQDGGQHTDVRFNWKHFVLIGVDLFGEFNGWKKEALMPDPVTGKYFIVKSLAPGL